MWWTFSSILLVLWALGLVSGASLGLWIHWFLLGALATTAFGFARSTKPQA